MKRALVALFVFLSWLALHSCTARALETEARSAIIVDHETGVVLMEKNADLPLPPASMLKLMTLKMVFEALEDDRMQLTDTLAVSQHAVSYKGSTMYLNTTDRVSVEDLIRGIVVLSGNDACVVLAETLSPDGTEAGFANLMNARAKELGLTSSVFVNSNGWPHPDQKMSARDLVALAGQLVREFPQYYHYFAETEFEFRNRAPANRFNRNPLLKLDLGADGLKTGYTSDAGYGLVGSAVRNNRRVVFAMMGLSNTQKRTYEAQRYVDWYYRQFKSVKLFEKDEIVLDAPVWLGDQRTVGATVEDDLIVPQPVFGDGTIEASAVFDGIVEAPVDNGTMVGRLVVSVGGLEKEISVPLVAASSIEQGGFGVRMQVAAQTLLKRLLEFGLSLTR